MPQRCAISQENICEVTFGPPCAQLTKRSNSLSLLSPATSNDTPEDDTSLVEFRLSEAADPQLMNFSVTLISLCTCSPASGERRLSKRGVDVEECHVVPGRNEAVHALVDAAQEIVGLRDARENGQQQHARAGHAAMNLVDDAADAGGGGARVPRHENRCRWITTASFGARPSISPCCRRHSRFSVRSPTWRPALCRGRPPGHPPDCRA